MEHIGDALPITMEAADYKHGTPGMIFLKYTSNALEAYARFQGERGHAADTENMGDYHSQNILWLPSKVRWVPKRARSKHHTIGRLINDATTVIQLDNLSLSALLGDCAQLALDRSQPNQLIDLDRSTCVGDPAAPWLRRDAAWKASETQK